MSYEEKKVLAEQFIRDAVADIGTEVDQVEFEAAVQHAIRALPPYDIAEAA